ncbi:MAG: DMT family transporter [Gammaproteobacteria bacterium]|nr:DMT family transporter [Gammaproteobacteria bacterium]
MSTRAWLAFAALGVIWGVPYFFIKLALQELSPWVVAWGRITLAALVLLPIAWRRGALHALGGHKLPILAFGVIEFVMPFSAISIGERWIDSSVTGILIASVPLTVRVIARFFGLHEPLGPWRLAGLVLGFLGVVSLLGFGSIEGPRGWAGAGCMLLAAICYAVGPLVIRRYLGELDSFGPIAASLAVSSLALLAPALATFPSHQPSTLALASIAILGLACTAVAMLLMFYLVRNAGPARASVITYINPAVAALLGVTVLGERLGVGGYLAFALILAGSWLATRDRRDDSGPGPLSRSARSDRPAAPGTATSGS